MTALPLYRAPEELRAALAPLRARGDLGFVPTMGALHEGHLSLIRASAAHSATTVVSVFVNPAQFGPNEDFDAYPRMLQDDIAAAKSAGADVIFAPDKAGIYPEPYRTFIEVEEITGTLCGRSRQGHFRGVATVVWKLLQIVDPDRAFFGAKDAQQVRVIRQMVRDLLGRWEIVACPTVRESDGLAMSSRYCYLTNEERARAAVILEAVRVAIARIEKGERHAGRIRVAIMERIEAASLRPDYVDVVSLGDLAPANEMNGDVLIAVAAFAGTTRLIDNVCIRIGDHVEERLP
ncbi:MAG: pantoate--beta-alanine ligase [Gemmatimonadetes bacterium]|nr:pantoate--beta-alanine ligase [Gemmatimonadota bacterium]